MHCKYPYISRLVLIGLALASYPAVAQFHLGAIGGLVLGDATMNVKDYHSYRHLWHAGITLGVRATENLVFEVQPGFAQRGVNIDDPFFTGGEGRERGTTFTYLELPILAKVSAPLFGVEPYLMTGLAPAVRIAGEVTGDNFSEPSTDLTSESSATDVAFVWGAGLGCPISDRISVALECRVIDGLTSVMEQSNADLDQRRYYYQTSGAQISVAVQYQLP